MNLNVRPERVVCDSELDNVSCADETHALWNIRTAHCGLETNTHITFVYSAASHKVNTASSTVYTGATAASSRSKRWVLMWQSVFRLILPKYCIDLIDMCSRTSVPRGKSAVSWRLILRFIWVYPAHPVRGAKVLQFENGMQVAALVHSSHSYPGYNPDAHWRIYIGWVQDWTLGPYC
jgi:hypothetical protein